MEMTSEETALYLPVKNFIQQGDIFCQEVVTPVVDAQKRIFRAADGRHGSVVFADGASAHVFEENELRGSLNSCARSALHTDPFVPTSDGHPELVVVHATLTSYFIVVSQTCDICGVDKPALLTTIILPIITVRDICRFQRLPFPSMNNQEVTIEEFIEANSNVADLRKQVDAFSYPQTVRKVFASWNPATKALEQDRNKVRNYLDGVHKKGWMHFLKQDDKFQVPESYVDFSVALTVPTEKLVAMKHTRIACIADPYRMKFAQEFSNRLSRVAVPIPSKPDKF
ncbi:MAG TPA: hypothetical protein VFW05_13645 [Verrucomicrobiae bacterium]|nr:hypothetical protein [Verrucomicrobiae bacterium]